MPRQRSSLARRHDAWELARTPVTNPYRDQFVDPYASAVAPAPPTAVPVELRPGQGPAPANAAPAAAVPTDERMTVSLPPGVVDFPRPGAPLFYPSGRLKTPPAAGWAAALGFILGSVLALFGVMVIAYISLQKELGPDRSFHAGGDASDLVLGLVNLALSCAYLISSSALASGRINGRISLTAAGWTTVFLAGYWWQSDRRVPVYLPAVMAAAAILMMMLAYTPKVSRWLGVLPVPQPE